MKGGLFLRGRHIHVTGVLKNQSVNTLPCLGVKHGERKFVERKLLFEIDSHKWTCQITCEFQDLIINK